ncbi:MAG: coenzyme F420-0:L-glutamate ligase [bacterium]|nr:coenzyme F420-0:L-glutamate ligase [bacterium]
MRFLPIKTRVLLPPKDNLFLVLDKFLPRLREGDIVMITSKVLAIHQGRCVKITEKIKKDNLIRSEADAYLPRRHVPDEHVMLTIKDNTLIPTAGIDVSNGNGYFVLWPKNVNRLLKQIWQYLRKKHRIKHLAVVSTDSHTVPLRFGVLGVSTGFYGLEPVIDHRGKPDIFGRPLTITRVNAVDALAVMSVFLMGESDETTPILIIRGAKLVTFTDKPTYKKLIIPRRTDNYAPLLKIFRKSRKTKKRRKTD